MPTIGVFQLKVQRFWVKGLGFGVWGSAEHARAGYVPPDFPRRLEFPLQATHKKISGSRATSSQPPFKGVSFLFLRENFSKSLDGECLDGNIELSFRSIRNSKSDVHFWSVGASSVAIFWPFGASLGLSGPAKNDEKKSFQICRAKNGSNRMISRGQTHIFRHKSIFRLVRAPRRWSFFVVFFPLSQAFSDLSGPHRRYFLAFGLLFVFSHDMDVTKRRIFDRNRVFVRCGCPKTTNPL